MLAMLNETFSVIFKHRDFIMYCNYCLFSVSLSKVCIVEVAQYSILLKGKHVGISASRPPEAGNFKVMIF